MKPDPDLDPETLDRLSAEAEAEIQEAEDEQTQHRDEAILRLRALRRRIAILERRLGGNPNGK